MFRAPGSSLNRLEIFGRDGDDTLNLANLDAIFGGLVTGDAGAGRDTLRLTGSGQVLDLTQISDADIQGLEAIDISGGGDNTLSLDVNEVLNVSTTTDTLRVVHDEGDAVNYGTGWTVEFPEIIASQFVHILKQGTNATIEVANTIPFRNPFRPLDTNRDGSVSPLDALIIVNRLNSTGSSPLATPTSVAGLTEFFYIDTNGGRFVSPVDVIRVVNFLNEPSNNTEGEDSSRTARLAVLAQPPMLPFDDSTVTTLWRDHSNRLRRTELHSVPTEYNSLLRENNPPLACQRRVAMRAADVAAALDQFFAAQDAASFDDLLGR